MLTREWIVETPARRLVRLEISRLTGELYLSVDDIGVHYDPDCRWHQQLMHEFRIDGVSYTLFCRQERLSCRYELLPTEDLPKEWLPESRAPSLSDAIALAVFGGILFAAAYEFNANPAVVLILVTLSVGMLSIAAYLGIACFRDRWQHGESDIENSPGAATSTSTSTRPRTAAIFRPLLADIHWIALRWKRRSTRRRCRGLSLREK